MRFASPSSQAVNREYLSTRTMIAVLGLPALAIIALWWPFGFSLGGLVEEWDILFLFARHGVFFIADQSSPIQLQDARPLTIVPQAIAYTLDPDSFLYWHVIQAISLLIKGFSAGIMGFYLTGTRAHAALLALLTMFYPADTMQLSFRSLHINFAVALALVASVLVIWAVHLQNRRWRRVVAFIASMVLGIALLTYEAVIGLAALPIFVLFARRGRPALQLVHDAVDVMLIWVCTIGTWFVFFLWAIKTGSQYHNVALPALSLNAILDRTQLLLTSGLRRGFYECWKDVGPILGSLSNYVYVAFFGSIILISLAWLAYDSNQREFSKENIWLSVRITCAGLVSFFFAFAPYLVEEAHLHLTQRVFLAPAIGGALFLLGCIVFMSKIVSRFSLVLISTLLITVCFISQLYQFDKYNQIYATVTKPILSALIPFITETNSDSHVVLNGYGFLSGIWDLGFELQLALGYVLPEVQVDHIFVCESRSGRLLPRAAGPIAQRGHCDETEYGIAIAEPRDKPILLRNAAIGRLDPNGSVSVEGGQAIVNKPPPRRALRLFSFSQWQATDSFFRARDRVDQFECRFESMWGYAVPCRTFGFFDGLPLLSNPSSSYAWIGETSAGFIFDIQPRESSYQLIIDTVDCVAPSRRMNIRLNGTTLVEKSDNPARIEATFSGRILQQRNNVLEIITELDDKLGLSFAVTSISIAPFPAK